MVGMAGVTPPELPLEKARMGAPRMALTSACLRAAAVAAVATPEVLCTR